MPLSEQARAGRRRRKASYYKERKRLKICVLCGKQDARKGRATCLGCGVTLAAATRRRYYRIRGREVPVYLNPPGDRDQEMGGCLITLSALASAAGTDLGCAAEKEYDRINTPAMIRKIRERNRTKPVRKG